MAGYFGFTETVKDDGIQAWGWTQSSGQGGSFPYRPPSDYMYDPAYPDTGAGLGTHGGCPNCIMTLVHLKKISAIIPPSTSAIVSGSRQGWINYIQSLDPSCGLGRTDYCTTQLRTNHPEINTPLNNIMNGVPDTYIWPDVPGQILPGRTGTTGTGTPKSDYTMLIVVVILVVLYYVMKGKR